MLKNNWIFLENAKIIKIELSKMNITSHLYLFCWDTSEKPQMPTNMKREWSKSRNNCLRVILNVLEIVSVILKWLKTDGMVENSKYIYLKMLKFS